MKYVKWILIAGYVYFILTKTIIGRPVQTAPIFRGLFWEVQNGYWKDIWLNIILFVPLGFLLGGWQGVVVGLVLSCGIETAQYIFRTGYCEVDDVLNNTIGAGIGAGMSTLASVLCKVWRGREPKIDEKSV